uniref:Uncharacterized protein n=1 Tax=Anguilla anguilla TaxID=7936 RepID=A0A0E9UC62_ANGAN
MEIISFPCCC